MNLAGVLNHTLKPEDRAKVYAGHTPLVRPNFIDDPHPPTNEELLQA